MTRLVCGLWYSIQGICRCPLKMFWPIVDAMFKLKKVLVRYKYHSVLSQLSLFPSLSFNLEVQNFAFLFYVTFKKMRPQHYIESWIIHMTFLTGLEQGSTPLPSPPRTTRKRLSATFKWLGTCNEQIETWKFLYKSLCVFSRSKHANCSLKRRLFVGENACIFQEKSTLQFLNCFLHLWN